ncbi:MAG: AMP-binding protein, partial [Antricoccus sp.]
MDFAAVLSRLSRSVPDDLAFAFTDGPQRSFAQLDQQVHRVAQMFAAHGVCAGDRVAILTMNRIEFIEACFASWRLGAIAVPLNFRLAPAELTYLLNDCAPKVIVVEEALDRISDMELSNPPARLICGRADPALPLPAGGRDYDNEMADASSDELPNVANEQSPCLIMYTSGTTGRPKGAVLTHSNMRMQCNNNAAIFGFRFSDEVNFVGVPLFHIAGIGSALGPFILG